jgi:hypothetical protein
MPALVNANFRKALNTYLRASAHLVDILAKEEPATLAEARPSRRKVRSDWGSNLPPLNSVGTEKSDPDRASPAMSSHETVRIYVAGCDGLKALAREFSLPLFKISTTRSDLLQRLAVLGADQYAANYRHGRKMITEPGFNRWSLTTLDFDLPKSLNSPIWIEPRALRVRLPRSLSADDFERLVRDALAGISLATWLETADGQRHFAELGIDLARAQRYTPYAYGAKSRVSPAEEIYIFRRADMPQLCKIIESVASGS